MLRDGVRHDGTILAVKYEDMIADKVKTFSDLFKQFDLDLKDLDVALTAFEKDSQRGTVVSRSRVEDSSNYIISDKECYTFLL